jgi:hypothetical protein
LAQADLAKENKPGVVSQETTPGLFLSLKTEGANES